MDLGDLANSEELAKKRILALLKDKKQEASQLLEDIQKLNEVKRLKDDDYEKNLVQRKIDSKDQVYQSLIKEVTTLEIQLPEINFPKQLFQYFKEFDYKSQRQAYNEYRQLAKNNRISSVVIHSEGKYEKLRDQEWFWKCILSTYMKTPNKKELGPFFHGHFSNIRILFNEFMKSVNSEEFLHYDCMEENIGLDEIEMLIPHFEERLNIKNVIIPIYLSIDWPNYELIYPFFEQIWQPLCERLAQRQNKDHWLKLFIIDNEVEDKDGRQYFVTNMQESVQTFMPFKLERVLIDPSDFKQWLADGQNTAERIFYKYEDECASFTCKFHKEEHYTEYMPECKTVEKLFDQICGDIPNKLININLKKLIQQYA